MKITRKVLVALLSLTLIISCFALTVSAAVGEINDDTYDDVFDYLDQSYYVNKDFAGMADSKDDYDAEGIVSKYFGTTEGFSVGGNNSAFLQMKNGQLNASPSNATSNKLYFDVAQKEKESFGINADVKIPAANITISLMNGTVVGQELATIKAKSISVGGGNAVTSKAVINTVFVDLKAHFLLNDDGSAKFTLSVSSTKGNEDYSVDLTADQVGDYTGFRMDFQVSKAAYIFNSLQMYPGDIPRTGADNSVIVSEYIIALSDAINATEDEATKSKYAAVIYSAVSDYGFDVSSITDADTKAKVEAAVVNAKLVLGSSYIPLYLDGVAAIDPSLSYADRIATYNKLVEYSTFVDLVYDIQEQSVKDSIDAATVKLNEEKASIDVVVANTKASVDLLAAFDEKNANYADLKKMVEVVSQKPIAPDYADDTYTAEKVAAALAKLEAVNTEIAARDALVSAFAKNVAKATKPDSETAEQFAARYEAFVAAKANYFDDVSYNAFAPEGAENYVEGLLDALKLVEQEMAAEQVKANDLADKVEYATVLGYLQVKTYLNKIAQDIEAANVGYPGVADTVSRYTALVTAADALTGTDTLAELLEYFTEPTVLPNGTKYAVSGNFGIDIVTDTVDGVSVKVVLNANSDITLFTFEDGVLTVGGKVIEGATALDVDVFVVKSGDVYTAFVCANGNVVKFAVDGAVTGVTATSTADAYVYTGSFVRNPVSSDEMATLLCSTVDIYNAAGNTTEENFNNWILVLYNTVIKANGFTAEGVVDEELKENTEATIIRIAEIVGNNYVYKLIEGAANIDVNAAYDNRLSFIETLSGYMAYIIAIEEEYVGAGHFEFSAEPDVLENARVAYEAEKELLVLIAEQTKTAIDTLNALPENPTYKELYEAVKIFGENPIDVTFFDDTVTAEAVADAYSAVKSVIKKFNAIDAIAKAFVENVVKADNTNVGEDETAESFRARYYAYLLAKENYFNDATYNEYIGLETTIESLLDIYKAVEIEMVAEIENATNVIGSVAAAAPLNFYAKAEAVAALASIIEKANLSFPGVEDAVAAYNALLEFVNAKSIERLALEFVEIYEGKKFFADNFDAAENTEWVRNVPEIAYTSDEFAFNKTSAFAYRVVDGVITFRTLSTVHFDVTPVNAGSFGINLIGKLSANDDKIALSVYDAARTADVVNGIELIVIEAGKVTVYTEDGPVTYNSTVAENSVFNLSAYYEATANGGSLSVTLDLGNGNSEVYFATVDNFAYKAFDLEVTEVAIDSIEAFAGSFNRSATNVAEISAKYINDIVAAYKADASVYFFDDLARVITNNDLALDTIADEELKKTALESVKTVLTVVGNDYANKIIAGAESIDVTSAYNARLDHYNAMMTLNGILAAIEKDFADVEITATAENIENARVALAAEKALLDTEKVNTFISYETALSVPSLLLASYKDLRDAYDIFTAHPICATFYDDELSAENVANAIALIDSITAAYNSKNAQVLSFYENVLASDNRNVSADETPEAFAARYAAYVNAKNLYFTDATYDEYRADGAMTVAEIIEVFNLVNTEMVAVIEYAEEFISIVREANLSLSYSVKKIALDNAAAFLANVETGYPGVNDAITLYNAIKQNVTDKEAAAKAYIEAVLAIANASDYAAKKAAIAAAKSLAAAGSDVSVDVVVNGVSITQANILFSDAESEITLLDLRVENFVSAVNAIESATDLDAKKAAIIKALSYKAKADVTNASVITATATLDKAIADYNAAVNAANTALEGAVNVMASAVVKTVPTKPAAQVVAIIKKFFD